MELSYEQHVELLKLARFLARVKISSSRRQVELDSFISNGNFVSYVNPDKEDSREKKRATMFLEKQKA